MALSDFETPELWREDLDRRWPERLVMKRALIKFIVDRLANHAKPRILELGIGDGEVMLALGKQLPRAEFVAMDLNKTLLGYCEERMSSERLATHCRDLAQTWSTGFERNFDMVYSFQSVHDFGGREALTSTYEQIATVLDEKGTVVNADFVVPFPQDKNHAPRRFPVEEHLQILNERGFESSAVIHREGLLACMTGSLAHPALTKT